MKKKIIALVCIAACVFCAFAEGISVRWQPDLAVSDGYDGTIFTSKNVDPLTRWRSTNYTGVELNLVSFLLADQHRISIPFNFEYYTKSLVTGRTFLDERLNGNFGLRYEYLFDNGFSVGGDVLFGYYGVPSIHAGNIYMRFRVMSFYQIKRWLSVGIPIGYSFGANMSELTIGATVRFNLDKVVR